MSKNSEYGEPKLERQEELDYDDTPIVRPSDKVVTFDPTTGYGEAATSDRELMNKRVEEASKQSVKKASKNK